MRTMNLPRWMGLFLASAIIGASQAHAHSHVGEPHPLADAAHTYCETNHHCLPYCESGTPGAGGQGGAAGHVGEIWDIGGSGNGEAKPGQDGKGGANGCQPAGTNCDEFNRCWF